ncbi:hypothetical protein [Micromonospora sonneratiae]|uniref:Uncharacterized protein n=1 Tax=Micromonospora sonneratiae TaxID=1184706 RepID=A0ABW3YBN0_9ACTN
MLNAGLPEWRDGDSQIESQTVHLFILLRHDYVELTLGLADRLCGVAKVVSPVSGTVLPRPGRRDGLRNVLFERPPALAVPVQGLGLGRQGASGHSDRCAHYMPAVRHFVDEIGSCRTHERGDLLGVERLPVGSLHAGRGVVVSTAPVRGTADRRHSSAIGRPGNVPGDQRVLDLFEFPGGAVLDADIPPVGHVGPVGSAGKPIGEIQRECPQRPEIGVGHAGEPLHLIETGRLVELPGRVGNAVEMPPRVLGIGGARPRGSVGERPQSGELGLQQVTIAHNR